MFSRLLESLNEVRAKGEVFILVGRRSGGLGPAGRRYGTIDKALKLSNQRTTIGLIAVALTDTHHHLPQVVLALQERVRDLGGDLQMAFAQLIEHVLHLMRELSHSREAHRTARPLQGVRRTENDLETLAGRIFFQLQGLSFKNFNLFVGLLQKEVNVLAHIQFGAHFSLPWFKRLVHYRGSKG